MKEIVGSLIEVLIKLWNLFPDKMAISSGLQVIVLWRLRWRHKVTICNFSIEREFGVWNAQLLAFRIQRKGCEVRNSIGSAVEVVDNQALTLSVVFLSTQCRDENGIVICQQRHTRFIFRIFHPRGSKSWHSMSVPHWESDDPSWKRRLTNPDRRNSTSNNSRNLITVSKIGRD